MLTGFTEMIHVPFLLEFAEEEAVIVTVPGETAETRPELFTVAIDVLPLLQVTDCSAPAGETVADNCFVLPALTVVLAGLTVTPVGAICAASTDSTQLPVTEVVAPRILM